jgi:hypothetical protein
VAETLVELKGHLISKEPKTLASRMGSVEGRSPPREGRNEEELNADIDRVLFGCCGEAGVKLETAIARMLHDLARFNPAALQADPLRTRDLVESLYHRLLPKRIRHELREYYTPDWLADRLHSHLALCTPQ